MIASQSNHAMLTITAMGLQAVRNCAPCVILRLLDAEEISELRVGLIEARKAIEATLTALDENLQQEHRRARQILEETSIP